MRKHRTRVTTALFATLALVLTACGGSSEPTASSSQTSESSATTDTSASTSGDGDGGSSAPAPAPAGDMDTEGVLKFTSAAPIRNLDPAKQTSYGGLGYMAMLWDRLTMLDTQDNIIPGLAESWEFAEDGSYLELKLRTDVKFHDGTPFDAEAVKVNIERGKTLADSSLVNDLSSIDSVEVVDPATVRLNLVEGRGVELPSVFTQAAGMMASPKAIADGVDLETNPGTAGSGPYIATEFIPNERVVVERSPSYWDTTISYPAGIEMLRMENATTRLAGVQTGETDLTFVSSANDVVQADQLASQGVFNVHKTTSRNVIGIYMRNQGALTNPDIRQAVALAVDPEAVSALYSGTCTPTRQLVPASDWSAIPNYTYPYAYDEAKAQQLVQAAGGGKLTITYAAGTNAELPANMVQAALTKVGLEVDLNPVPNGESEPRFLAGEFEMYVAASWSPKVDPAATAQSLLNVYKVLPEPGELEQIAAEAANPLLSQEERAPMYQQLWAETLEQAWYVPLCNSTYSALYADKVAGLDNGIPWTNIGIWDLRHVGLKK